MTRRHKGLLDFLDRIERRGFPLQMDAVSVYRQFTNRQWCAWRHMLHQFRQARKDIVACAITTESPFSTCETRYRAWSNSSPAFAPGPNVCSY
jgi:hypothetical protein